MGARKKPDILVVDDDPDCGAFMCAALGSSFQVRLATNAEDALRQAAAKRPDCFVLDVMMPGKDGFTLFRQLGRDEDLRHIPVLMLSEVNTVADMSFSPEIISTYLGRQPVAFLEKPIQPEKLLEAVTQALAR